jgi:hypothetical protein
VKKLMSAMAMPMEGMTPAVRLSLCVIMEKTLPNMIASTTDLTCCHRQTTFRASYVTTAGSGGVLGRMHGWWRSNEGGLSHRESLPPMDQVMGPNDTRDILKVAVDCGRRLLQLCSARRVVQG